MSTGTGSGAEERLAEQKAKIRKARSMIDDGKTPQAAIDWATASTDLTEAQVRDALGEINEGAVWEVFGNE